jgi:adenylate cyclase
MAWLVVTEEGQPPRIIEITTAPFRIGRRADNDLVLADQGASREHSRIDQEGGAWGISDLGAANGTYLNGQRLEARERTGLEPGDEIRIGRATIHFFEKRPGSAVIEKPDVEEETADSTRLLPTARGPSFARSPDLVRSANEVALPKKLEYFTVLHELAKLLLAARELRDIGDTALDLLFRVIPVERGAIALLNEESTLVTLVQRTRKGTDPVSISQTISNWVLRERVAIITSDARHDPRFQRGESIHMYHVRSAMCVPLWSETDTQGLLYLDNLFDAHAFTEEELELVTAVANQVAIGIRQVRLSEQIRDEAIIRANLARYHSPDVVEMILRHSLEGRDLGFETTDEVVTVLFADICGFTTLSERLTPADVAALLNTFFERTTRAIFAFKGSVNKYIGDAIMAIFGAPLTSGNHPELAVRAALAMQEEVEAVQATLGADRRFRVRIGVNTGRVVVGNIGSPQRMEFTVLGDAVNVAQRLESICEPGRVYVGEETYLKTRDLFQFRDLGERPLKGKSQHIRVYDVTH